MEASQFANFTGASAPFSSLRIRFTVTYDDAAAGFRGAPDAFEAVTDGQVNAGPFSAAAGFGYFPPSGGMFTQPRLVLGGAINGVNVMLPGSDDFSISFDPTASGAIPVMLGFSVKDTATGFLATNATARAVIAPAGVPEPATWGMLILGFAVVGAAARAARSRNERVAAVAPA